MLKTKQNQRLFFAIALIFVLVFTMTVTPVETEALTGLEASGYVKSSNGAFLRKNTSTKSRKLAGLPYKSPVIIHKEIFTSKKKRSATYRWYYVTTGAGTGYMRSDTIAVSKYGSATGYAKKKLIYRAGAGKKMKKRGNIKKNSTFTILLEAKAKGSGKRWYKIRRGGKICYVSSSNTKIYNIRSGADNTGSNNPAITVNPSPASLKVINATCSWAVNMANDNRFHYGKKPNSQHNGCYYCGTQTLSGGRSKKGVLDYQYSYCCNPFVHAAFSHGGDEKTMLQVCKGGGSYDFHAKRGYDISPLFAKLGKPSMGYLRKGDVICWSYHVALYLGDGKIVEAAGGDDNVRNSNKWNNSIRVCSLSSTRYAKAQRCYRYIGADLS